MVADSTFQCFMAPPILNPFRRPYILACKSRVENIDNSTNIRLDNCATHHDKKCDPQEPNTEKSMPEY